MQNEKSRTAQIQCDYLERVYAGWLGKIIGVRYGAPIEGWMYERIRKTYGKLDGYVSAYKTFAADDDTNGPMFFLRAIDDYGLDATVEQMGLTWLNYAPYEHGFYWWGGYGKSTEHTAYLNLRSGIPAPRSGSVEQNGEEVAEQIGGQIFIDVWGLIAPGNPKLAAEYAGKMASVSHGGNGIYGGQFIAACIAAAFTQTNMEKIIAAGLSVIPGDCEYRRMADAVIAFWKKSPCDWEEAFRYVRDNFGYDKYPGNCHIIPNSAVIILSLLYGSDSFDNALNICNMCGWDTDCNVANVGTVMGVLVGLDGIDYNRWRAPINDFLAASSVMGSMNIMDIPANAAYIAGLGYKLAGEKPPKETADIIGGKAARFHFELPGSTHAFMALTQSGGEIDCRISGSDERAATGKRSLKIVAPRFPRGGGGVRVFHRTYYESNDFSDSRYDPGYSPILYPGQTVSCRVCCDTSVSQGLRASVYVLDSNSGELIEGDVTEIGEGFTALSLSIPPMDGACIRQAGVIFRQAAGGSGPLCAWIDDFGFSGGPDYGIDFSKEHMDVWHNLHKEVSQFTWLKGIWYLEGGILNGSCADFGEAYTGDVNFRDYSFTATIKPKLGQWHGMNFRVQGAVRSYAVVLAGDGKLILMKNENGYRALCRTNYPWENGGSYRLTVQARGDELAVFDGDRELLRYIDADSPYLGGAIGVSIHDGSRCHYADLRVKQF
ncbi:MAG: ADP-ribosylglycohydrolase family protein [Oscillospiraceae bacterium]|nr:ADP-ribosylglycohydrolase family protein [Oscillospiraceae bacterium]